MSTTGAESDLTPDTPAEAVAEATAPERPRRPFRRLSTFVLAIALLFGVPWATLVLSGQAWPLSVILAGTVLFVAAAAGLPRLMMLGHARGSDRAAIAGDTLLGVVWIMFTASLAGNVLRLVLLAAGVHDPDRARIVTVVVLAVVLVALAWGYAEAMRVPRIRRLDVPLDRLGPGLDGLRVVLITDTHYGPIDRVRWSVGVGDAVNELDADVLCHTGDIADGTVAARLAQAAPLAGMAPPWPGST